MQRSVALFVAIAALIGLAHAGRAGPVTTSVTTTTTTTTTTSTLMACFGTVQVDPGGTLSSLPPSVPTVIPIVVMIQSGVMDLIVSDGNANGTLGAGCAQTSLTGGRFTSCTYTAPAGPQLGILITATLFPHSLGFTCGPGSITTSGSKAFDTTSTTTTTTTEPSTTTTSTSTTTTTLPGGRIAVCHKDRKTLLVDAAALDHHLHHGDSEGACPD